MDTVRDDGSQQSMCVATADLPQSAGHPFYERVNRILEAAGFDAFVEGLCAPFYAMMGRPSLAPGRYFRLLLIGYFEGLDSDTPRKQLNPPTKMNPAGIRTQAEENRKRTPKPP